MKKGFTLVELLIVISIIIVLVAFVLINIRGQIARANDAKRKSDLYTLHNAFEGFFNDNNGYPPADSIQTCGSNLSQYLKNIPCDPKTRSPYGYIPSLSTGGYRVCAILEDKTDPAIAATGCGGPTGCGIPGGYNYCLAQGTTASAVSTSDYMVGPGGVKNHIACTKGGSCNWFDNPALPSHKCPISWETDCPPGACDISKNRCLD